MQGKAQANAKSRHERNYLNQARKRGINTTNQGE
jgi:hypothetical protein